MRNTFFFTLIALVLTVFLSQPVLAAGEVAIYTGNVGWITQEAAAEQAQICVDMLNAAGITNTWFDSAGDMGPLANWMKRVTGNGELDVCVLYGMLPESIYPSPNSQPDGSIAERFIEATDGDAFINHGDYMFYWGDHAKWGDRAKNAERGLQNMMDINGITMWPDGPAKEVTSVANVKVTPEGRAISPSLRDFGSNRPFHVDALAGDWKVEVSLAQNSNGTRADPVIVRDGNRGRLIPVMQVLQVLGIDEPMGAVAAEITIYLMSKIPVGAPARLRFDVPAKVSVGEKFTATLRVSDVRELSGAQFILAFNPAVLEVADVNEGAFLSQDGSRTFFQVTKIDNVGGELSGIRLARLRQSGVSGSGVLLQVVFRVKGAGNSGLMLRDVKLGNASGGQIPPNVSVATVRASPVPDVTGDGRVDILDLVLVSRHFGPASAAPAGVDINGDGAVDILDLILLAHHLGN